MFIATLKVGRKLGVMTTSLLRPHFGANKGSLIHPLDLITVTPLIRPYCVQSLVCRINEVALYNRLKLSTSLSDPGLLHCAIMAERLTEQDRTVRAGPRCLVYPWFSPQRRRHKRKYNRTYATGEGSFFFHFLCLRLYLSRVRFLTTQSLKLASQWKPSFRESTYIYIYIY